MSEGADVAGADCYTSLLTLTERPFPHNGTKLPPHHETAEENRFIRCHGIMR